MGYRLEKKVTNILTSSNKKQLKNKYQLFSVNYPEGRECIQDLRRVLPYEAIPGPKPLPIVGNFWRFLPLIGSYPRDSQVLLIKKLRERYGNVVRLTGLPGKPDMVITCDPRDFEKVYRTDGAWPTRNAMPSYKRYRDHVRKDFFKGVGSMVTEQGKNWHAIRTIANDPMLNPRMTEKYVQPINEVASDFVDRMNKLRTEDGTLPETFNNELNKWALESVALLALDARLGCLEDAESAKSESDAHRLVNAVLTMMKLTYDLDVNPTPISFFKRRRFNRAVDVQIDISMRHINRCVERMERRKGLGEGYENRGILEEVLITGNRTVACTVAIDMLHAGIDTTARSMENVLFHLSKNPEAQASLRRELELVLPEVDSPVRQADILKLPYLKACIKESMRIMPTAIGSLRELGKDVVLSGYAVPKGTMVLMYHVEASNSPDEFPEPDRYLPERWLRGVTGACPEGRRAAPSARKASPFSFLPFGFGPRACIGQRFANLEMEILLAKIFRRWNVTFESDYRLQSKLLYGLATPLTLRLIEP